MPSKRSYIAGLSPLPPLTLANIPFLSPPSAEGTIELANLTDLAIVAEALEAEPKYVAVNVKHRFDPSYDALPIGA